MWSPCRDGRIAIRPYSRALDACVGGDGNRPAVRVTALENVLAVGQGGHAGPPLQKRHLTENMTSLAMSL